MNNGLVQAVVAAVSAGSACSVCGASANSAFLSSYIITHKKITVPVFSFLVGKTAMTAALCVLSSLFGEKILDSNGLAGRVDVYLMAQVFVLVVAVALAIRWIYYEVRCKGSCHSGGKHCAGAYTRHESACGSIALFASGAACGATPCAPLLIVLGQAAVSTPLEAIASGAAFSITGFLSPVIIWLAISRLLAKQMHREILQWIKWFQFGCYVLLAGISLYTIIIYKL